MTDGRTFFGLCARVVALYVLAASAVLYLPGRAAAQQWTNCQGGVCSSGNVGVGATSSPDKVFTVVGQLPAGGVPMTVIRGTGPNNGMGLAIDAAGTGNNNIGFSVGGVNKASFTWDVSRNFLGFLNWAYSSNDFALRLNSDGSLTYHDSMTYPAPERFRLTAAGNVGIGSSPSVPLDIKADNVPYGGQIRLQATDYDQITFYSSANPGLNGTNRLGAIYYDIANATLSMMNGGGNHYLVLNQGGGNVGIGTPTPAKTLDVLGDINASGTITGGNIQAKYQDVAEWVPSSQKLIAGTVVVLDTNKTNHVLASTSSYDTSVAGVISERPGIALGEGGDGKVLVATTGRVRVKVDATLAPIKVGDLLVTSDLEGVAMKSVPVVVGGRKMHAPGTIIGKALEPLEKGTGEILVLLSLQ